MPLFFWWEAFHTTVFLINRLLTPILSNISHFQKLFGHLSNYSFLRNFGCSCYPHLRPYNTHKLQFHSCKCLVLGYSSAHKGYLCLHPSSQVFISRNVIFNELEFPYIELFSSLGNDSSSQTTHMLPSLSSTVRISTTILVSNMHQPPIMASFEAIKAKNHSQPHDQLEEHVIHSGLTTTTFPQSKQPFQPIIIQPCQQPVLTFEPNPYTHPMVTRSKAGIYKPKFFNVLKHPLIVFSALAEPLSIKQALSDPNWKKAMDAEFQALKNNDTWDLVPYKSKYNVVGNKWVFKLKYNYDCSLNKYKVRLVAKGFHQTPRVDFSETYSLVIKPFTIRVVLALAMQQGWDIRQLDVNNALKNGHLQEDMYMS